MWLNWLPWRYIVRRVARARGFIDPIALLSHLHRFAQPSEVAAPMELLRAGVVFHARGLMNTGAIQHNLDWVWPYWVERQFDPHDESFIPRAFSITHVNLTHRNWTAIGLPDCDWLPLVDPRGLLTPYWDSWSLDAWVVSDAGALHLPSQARQAEQQLLLDLADGVVVATQTASDSLTLATRSRVVLEAGLPVCLKDIEASSGTAGWLVVALRPYNPEGVTFVHDIDLMGDSIWRVDGINAVHFSEKVERHRLSAYQEGDVRTTLLTGKDERAIRCDVGMATGAAMFRLEPNRPRQIRAKMPFQTDQNGDKIAAGPSHVQAWPEALRGHCRLEVPDARFRYLYDAALRTLVLHSPSDVYPGPYTYKRFWFRDAAFILHAMLCAGMAERARRTIDRFPLRQLRSGYFRSQEGEWDSNGEALWIMQRYCELIGEAPPEDWKRPALRAAEWIIDKRLDDDLSAPHAGLLPSGFSAEHLGPNDYYYWDDFWGVAGLRAAQWLADAWGESETAESFRQEADDFSKAIDRSIAAHREQRGRPGVPASPYRRMDAGAIGSIAVGYPLQLWSASDQRLLETVEFLMRECFYRGGFFQDMIHSGINAYLTLHIAQVLLRAGDPRYLELAQAVAQLASPTGQWPEAIHPRTLGGCMGDGQHVWAAAEWVLLMRNMFVREEADHLVFCSGIPIGWLDAGNSISFGPTTTPCGDLQLRVEKTGEGATVHWTAKWRRLPASVNVRLPGFVELTVKPEAGVASLVRRGVDADASSHSR